MAEPTPDSIPTVPARAARSARFWRLVAHTLVLLAVFVAGLVVAVILHANTRPGRAIVTSTLNAILTDTFYGSVRVESVAAISLQTVHASRVSVFDEAGERVLTLNDIRLELDAVDNLLRYVHAGQSWTLEFPHARVEQARVLLVTDATSQAPTLSRALTPRPRPPRSATPRARPLELRVSFPVIELGRVTGALHMASLDALEPRLVSVRGSVLVTQDGVAVDVERFGVGVRGLDVRVRGTGSVRLRAPGPLEVQFAGFAGDSEVHASLRLERNELTGSLTSPRLTSSTVQRLWPAWPLDAAVSLDLRVQGQLPKLQAELNVTEQPNPGLLTAASGESAYVQSSASLTLSSGFSADIDTELANLSLHLLDETLPATDIDARIITSLRQENGALHLQAEVRTAASEVNGVAVPPVIAQVNSNGQRVEADVTLEEPGAKTSATVSYEFESQAWEASVAVPAFTLRDQRRIPGSVRGRASIHGQLKGRGALLDVDLRAEVSDVKVGPLELGHLELEAQSAVDTGQAEQSRAQWSLRSRNVRLAALSFESAAGSGVISTERVQAKLSFSDADGRALSASGSYQFSSGELTNVEVSAARGALVGEARVTRFDPSVPAVDVERLEVRSTACGDEKDCPRLTGFGRYRPGRLQGELHARAVALERLGPILGIHVPVSGELDLDFEALIGDANQQAQLSLRASRFSVDNYNRTQVELTASLQDDGFEGQFRAQDAIGVSASGSWAGRLDGDPFRLATWEAVTGTAELAVSEVSLQALPWLVDVPWLAHLEGDLDVRVALQRTRERGFPTLFAQLGVANLEAQLKGSDGSADQGADEDADKDAEAPRLPPSALYVTTTFNPEQNTVYASASLRDEVGTLLTATGSGPFVPGAWFEPGQALVPADGPISLNVNLPQRSLRDVPAMTNSPLTGDVDAQVVVYGTVAAPQAKAFLGLRDLSVPGLQRRTPVSLQTTAHYALPEGNFSLELVGASFGRSVALGKADGILTWPPPANAPPFQGEARVAVDGLPLALFAPLSELELSGEVTGLIEIDRSATRSLNVLLGFDDVSSGRAAIGSGTLRATGQQGLLTSQLLLQRGEQELLLTLDAFANSQGLPFPHQMHRINALLRMRQMNAAAFSPLLSQVVARLSGELDTNVAFEWERDLTAEDPSFSTRVSGIAHLRNARAYVDGLGLELQDVSVDAVASPHGDQTHLLLDRVRAKARSEEVNFEGRGQLQFSGTRLASGQATAVLRQVPLTLQGLNLGRATGAVSAELERRDAWEKPGPYRGKPYLFVTATLDDWSMRASSSASRSLIDISPNPDIEVVQGLAAATVSDALPYRVQLELGSNVRFALADLDLPLSGSVQLELADESEISGTIALERGGRVPIFGRVFEVEDGTLRLNPQQPSNPDIDISLSGQSKDGSLVYVSLSGTLQEPIVSPPLAQLQELLGGGTATALSGGAQALGLTSLLGDAVQLRVGSNENEQELARYSAAVQIRDNLWFEVNYEREDNNAFTQGSDDAVSGTLDYRLNNNWSLRTEAGTTGGSVDVVWQYRY